MEEGYKLWGERMNFRLRFGNGSGLRTGKGGGFGRR